MAMRMESLGKTHEGTWLSLSFHLATPIPSPGKGWPRVGESVAARSRCLPLHIETAHGPEGRASLSRSDALTSDIHRLWFVSHAPAGDEGIPRVHPPITCE